MLAVNQDTRNSRQIERGDTHCIWLGESGDGTAAYLLLFNLSGKEQEIATGVSIPGKACAYRMRDCWKRRDLDTLSAWFTVRLPAHGAGLYRLEQ